MPTVTTLLKSEIPSVASLINKRQKQGLIIPMDSYVIGEKPMYDPAEELLYKLSEINPLNIPEKLFSQLREYFNSLDNSVVKTFVQSLNFWENNQLEDDLKDEAANKLDQLLIAQPLRPEFLILETGNEKDQLFEYYEDQLIKLACLRHNDLSSIDREKMLQQTLKQINPTYVKPLFIIGENAPELTHPNIISISKAGYKGINNSNHKIQIQHLTASIASNWDYWQKRSLAGAIQIAENNGSIVKNLLNVLSALENHENGIIIYSNNCMSDWEKLRREGGSENLWKTVAAELSRFINNGNKIEELNHPAVLEAGGILFIPEKKINLWQDSFYHSKMNEYAEIF